jgi:hypothetical protein
MLAFAARREAAPVRAATVVGIESMGATGMARTDKMGEGLGDRVVGKRMTRSGTALRVREE